MTAMTESFTDEQLNFAMGASNNTADLPKTFTYPKTFQTFMGVGPNTKIHFAENSNDQKNLDMLSESSSDDEEDDGEKTPPTQMPQQRGML